MSATATNTALPKLGRDQQTSASSKLQVWYWGWTRTKNHLSNFNFAIGVSITAGQTCFKAPNFVNAKRWQQCFFRTSLMQRIFVVLFCCLLLILSCKFLEQKDFILRKTLINKSDESIFYDIYQTGIDNYTFEFFHSYKNDTTKIFDYHLNDALHSALRLQTTIVGDTVLIESNMPFENKSFKLASGSVLFFREPK